MGFIYENIGTIAVAAVLILVVAAILRKLRSDKKKGVVCSCGNSCSGCACHGMCHAFDDYEKKHIEK